MRSKKRPTVQSGRSFIATARLEQIIDCAIDTIANLGYAQASLEQIARRAGISKSAIAYHWKSKEKLISKILDTVYRDGADFMSTRINVASPAASMLTAYIEANVEYIETHRLQVLAVVEIIQKRRTADGRYRAALADAEQVLVPLEAILRKGHHTGEFRDFDRRVMSIAIRSAIDALPPLLLTDPDMDTHAYAGELSTLFVHAALKVGK
jgi:TetR/AcrR family transcriptional regulator, fatty acid metabolism regulator protein